jgi:hypothetical protein
MVHAILCGGARVAVSANTLSCSARGPASAKPTATRTKNIHENDAELGVLQDVAVDLVCTAARPGVVISLCRAPRQWSAPSKSDTRGV